MNYFNKKNIVILSIAILLIVNIATIGTVIYLTYKRPPITELPPPIQKRSLNEAKKGLDLNQEQKDAFVLSQNSYREKTKEVFTQLHKARVSMMDEFSKPEPDSMVLYDLAKQSGLIHEELKRLTINHLLELKSVCTEDQFKYLERMFRGRIMDEGPGRGHHPDRVRKYRNRKPDQN